MRHILLLLAALVTGSHLLAQAPQGFTFQAVVRDANDELVSSSPVGMRISILQGSISGTAVYAETHATSTNANGLVSLHVGGGTVQSGSLNTINWGAGPYFIKSEADPNGGTNYTISGTQEMLSVPYALNAATSEDNRWATHGNDITNVNTGNVGIGTTQPTSALDIDGEVRIRGGSPGAGKVLTSAADGSATWQAPTSPQTFISVEQVEILTCPTLPTPCTFTNQTIMATCPSGYTRLQLVNLQVHVNLYSGNLEPVLPGDDQTKIGAKYSHTVNQFNNQVVRLKAMCISGVPGL